MADKYSHWLTDATITPRELGVVAYALRAAAFAGVNADGMLKHAVGLNELAARREAEAKSQTIPPKVPLMVCPDERACTGWMCKTQGCIRMMGGIPRERNITGEMAFGEGLDSADAELAHSLRSVVTVDHSWPPMALSIIRRYEADRHNAAETINRLLRHVEHWRGSFVAEQKASDTLKARVAELEKERGNIHASYEAERRMHHAAGDKLARLSAALKRIGKTYGANYARLIHSETQIKEIVEAALAEAGHAK